MASLEGAEGEAIPAAVEQAREERAGFAPLAGAEGEALDARVAAALEAAERRHAAYLAGLARRDELAALVQEAEALAGLELAAARAAFTALETKWREATAAAHLPDLRARWEAVAAALRARGHAARAEQAQKDQEHLDQLLRLADRAEALVAKGASASLRDTDHALREIREALEHPGHFPTRKDRDVALARLEAARKQLYPLVQQLREDAEWKRWANVNVQEELCAEAEALVAEADLEKAASALRELDARWKQAKEAPKDKAEALWTRFKAARDQVKAKADAFLAQQAEELAANLKKKEALCERAEALAESERLAEDRRGAARAAGRVEGDRTRAARGVAAAVGALPQALRPVLHALAGAPRPAQPRVGREPREEGSPVREGRGPRRSRPTGRPASAELKRLQAEWRTIGAVKKSRSEAVWQRFRAACDHFFDRYKNRDEHARQAAQRGARGRSARSSRRSCRRRARRASRPPTSWRASRRRRRPGARRAGCPTTRWRRSTSASRARATGRRSPSPARSRAPTSTPRRAAGRRRSWSARVEGLLEELPPGGGAPPPQTAAELAARLRDALATNTIGGRAAVEAKWNSAATEVESAQAAWKRLGPVPGAEGRDARRALRAGLPALLEERPKPTKTEWSERPRGERRNGASGAGAGPARGSTGPTVARRRLPCRRGGPPGRRPRALRAGPGGRAGAARGADAAQVLATFRSARVLAPFPRRGGEAGARWQRIIRAHERTLAVLEGRGRGRELPSGKELRDLGRDLFETLLPGDVRRLYDTARAACRRDGRSTSSSPRCSTGWPTSPGSSRSTPSRREFLATSSVNLVRNAFTAVPAEAPARRTRAPARAGRRRAAARAPRLSTRRAETSDLREAFRSLADAGRAEVEILDAGDAAPPPATARGGGRRRAALRRPRRRSTRRSARASLLLEDERGRRAPARRRGAAPAGLPARAAPRLPERLRDRAGRARRLEPRGRARARGRRPARGGREPVRGARRRGHRSSRASSTPSSPAGRALGDAAREARVAVARRPRRRPARLGGARRLRPRPARAAAVRRAAASRPGPPRARAAARRSSSPRTAWSRTSCATSASARTCSTSRGTPTRRSGSIPTRRRGRPSRRRPSGSPGAASARSR